MTSTKIFLMAANRRPAVPREVSDAKREWHRAQALRPLREKVALLLELQRQDLPLISRRRALRSWEKPWPIDP